MVARESDDVRVTVVVRPLSGGGQEMSHVRTSDLLTL